MGPRRIPLQSVDDSGLRGAQCDPVLRGLLERQEKRLGPLPRSFLDVRALLELDLKREFSDQRTVVAPRPPQRHIRDGRYALAKIQDTDVLEDFLDDRSATSSTLCPGSS